MSGKARQCSGCNHIETKNLGGKFLCASCGSTGYTLYVPSEDSEPSSAAVNNHGWVQYERDDGQCARCGALLMDPEGSAYCAKCEKYLDLD